MGLGVLDLRADMEIMKVKPMEGFMVVGTEEVIVKDTARTEGMAMIGDMEGTERAKLLVQGGMMFVKSRTLSGGPWA